MRRKCRAGERQRVPSYDGICDFTTPRSIHPWAQIQPDIQYIFNPGAGIVNPNDPTQKIKNEL